jgi:hypothetical protein
MRKSPSNRRQFPLRTRASKIKFRICAASRWLILIGLAQQISCGGGVSSVGVASNTTPLVVTLTVAPATAQMQAGGTLAFTVTVENSTNPAVTWQVNGLNGGNASVGTITPSGAATASYNAPASVSAVSTETVTAILQSDTTKTGSASVTINPAPTAAITVSPAGATVVAGTSQQFSATVQNGPQAVIWEVNGLQGGNPKFGTITSLAGATGFYTAPSRIPNPPDVTITALLQNDLSTSGSTIVTIISSPPPAVSISPTTASVAVGQMLQFTSSVQNSNAGIVWEVNGLPGGDPADGTITSSGTYAAPASLPTPQTITVTAVLQTDSSVFAAAGVTIILPADFAGIYSWRNDSALTGQNTHESLLTPSSVDSTHFGKLFGCSVDGQIYAQPLYVSNVSIPGQGTHNIVYVATEHDSVYAFDADASSCQILWQTSFIDPANSIVTVQDTQIGSDDIEPEIGITGTPVIDPSTATLYVVAKTFEHQTYTQKLHALNLVTGAETFGGPANIQAVVNSAVNGQVTFDPLKENQRSALLLAGGKVYVAFDSYGDTDLFHGWVLAYDALDLTKSAVAVFNTTPNGFRGGIGQSGGAPSADAGGNIFVGASDGTFDATGDNAETLLRLQVNLASSALTIVDSFTPWNEAILNVQRKFFGSTGVLLLPNSAGSTAHPNLALAGSEAGTLYLLDRDHLGQFTAPPGPDNVVQTLCVTADGDSGTPASILGTPAYWAAANAIYMAAADDTLKAFQLASGRMTSPSCPAPASPTSRSTETFDIFGASPVISSNGSANGIIWALDTSGYAGSTGTSLPAVLRAYDATNLATELYASPSNGVGSAGPAIKFAVPTVANGKVYVGTQNELSVFGLLP